MSRFHFSGNRMPKKLRKHKAFRKYALKFNRDTDNVSHYEYQFAWSTVSLILKCKCSICKKPLYLHDYYDDYQCGCEDE